MRNALVQAGFQAKIIHGTEGLHWDSRGRLIDDEDNQIKTVWKTWAWETMLEQLREDATGMEVAPPIRTGYPEDKVRLIDVLLRPEVLVYEPLWTAIPSNKAILPVLWSLFPNHRYLLEAGFELTPELSLIHILPLPSLKISYCKPLSVTFTPAFFAFSSKNFLPSSSIALNCACCASAACC